MSARSMYPSGSAGTPSDQFRCPSHDEITEARRPTVAEAEVLGLLEWATGGEWVRLTLHDWRRVDTVAAALGAARVGTERPVIATSVPLPRDPGLSGQRVRAERDEGFVTDERGAA